MQERITQLGMDTCRVCGSGQLFVHKRPGVVTIGGILHEKGNPRWDPESNVLFMVMTVCDLCGNTQFFDSERLTPSTEGVFVPGTVSEEEEAAREALEGNGDDQASD